MTDKEDDLAKKVRKVLDRKGVNYLKNVVVGDSSTDFLVFSPTNQPFAFELKNWWATDKNIMRASKLASLYTNTSGTASAYVVLPGDFESDIESGVISSKEFSVAIDQIFERYLSDFRIKSPEVREKSERSIFVAMPFKDEYDDTFVVAIEPAVIEAGASATRVDHEHFSGDVVKQIKLLLAQSIAVVADVSESRPNVLYELGYGEARGLPAVQICSTPQDEMPFDIRNNKTIFYKRGQTAKLKGQLKGELAALVG